MGVVVALEEPSRQLKTEVVSTGYYHPLGWVAQGFSEDLGPQDRGSTSTAGWSVQAGAQGNLLFLQVFL